MSLNPEDIVEDINLNLKPTEEQELEDEAQKLGLTEIPNIHDESWTDYVLSKLSPNELVNGRPRVNGLLRFARGYFGGMRIETSVAKLEFNGKDVVVATTTVEINNTSYENRELFTGVADCNIGNTGGAFANYPTAVAQTRSLGRALKLALCLDVHTAEEINEDSKESNSVQEEKINSQQINMIRNLSKRNNVNIVAMLNDEYPKWNKNIESVPRNVASSLVSKLSHIGNKSVKLEDKYKGFVDF